MTKQDVLSKDMSQKESDAEGIGNRLFLKFSKSNPQAVSLYNRDILIKNVDLSDRVAKRLLVVDAVEMGAIKSRLAEALQISRQTIHNYTEIKKYFGLEGLINNYSVSTSKNLSQQRHNHSSNLGTGNKGELLSQARVTNIMIDPFSA